MCRYRKQLGGHGVAIASTRIDAERDGARMAAQGMEGQRDEVTTLADQMGTLSSAVGPDAWCGDSADAFRAHIDELGRNASGLAQGYDHIAVALRGHAQALDTLYAHVKDAEQRLEQGERDRKLPRPISRPRAGRSTARRTTCSQRSISGAAPYPTPRASRRSAPAARWPSPRRRGPLRASRSLTPRGSSQPPRGPSAQPRTTWTTQRRSTGGSVSDVATRSSTLGDGRSTPRRGSSSSPPSTAWAGMTGPTSSVGSP